MLHIGCHLSSTKGFAAMGRQALAMGADTFQFFTRNPRGSRAKPLDEADAAALRTLLAENRFAPSSYTRSVPMLRLNTDAVCSGYSIPRSFAVSPTYTVPSSSTLTTEGVSFAPRRLGMTVAAPSL